MECNARYSYGNCVRPSVRPLHACCVTKKKQSVKLSTPHERGMSLVSWHRQVFLGLTASTGNIWWKWPTQYHGNRPTSKYPSLQRLLVCGQTHSSSHTNSVPRKYRHSSLAITGLPISIIAYNIFDTKLITAKRLTISTKNLNSPENKTSHSQNYFGIQLYIISVELAINICIE